MEMEKEKSGRIIAIVALVIAVIGLSVGFAAFSTSLNINTAARLTPGANNWNVGFSVNGTDLADVSTASTKAANESGNPGVIDVTKYTIGQNTNATLSATAGSSVSYSLNILNKGSLTAYLDEVDFDNVAITCSNAPAGSSSQIDSNTTSNGGNTTTITAAECQAMFGVTLTINSTDYTTTTAGSGSIAAGSSVPVTLTVAYTNTAAAQAAAAKLDGDIIVSIGTITVVYTSNSGN